MLQKLICINHRNITIKLLQNCHRVQKYKQWTVTVVHLTTLYICPFHHKFSGSLCCMTRIHSSFTLYSTDLISVLTSVILWIHTDIWIFQQIRQIGRFVVHKNDDFLDVKEMRRLTIKQFLGFPRTRSCRSRSCKFCILNVNDYSLIFNWNCKSNRLWINHIGHVLFIFLLSF